MKANKKYTALEILQEAGVKKAEEKFGNVRIRIGGIRGIVNPNHLIMLQPETNEIDVIVGNDKYTVDTKENEEVRVASDATKEVIEEQGKEKAEQFEQLQARKAEAYSKVDKKQSELSEKYKDLDAEDRNKKITEELNTFKEEVYKDIYK